MNYFIIDQTNPHTGEFDEHKIVTGATIKNAVEAALVYLSNYEPNWQGLGAISEATPHIFDLWLKLGNRKAPFSNSDFAEKPLHLSLVGDAAPDPSKSRHWITTETGSHILINGNGEVLAGAGGKLAGKKFSVPAGSKDVSKHIETVEKIAQAGYEKHGGDKADYLRMGRNKGSSAYFAREYEKKGLEGLPEGHLKEALVDKPADDGAANGGQNSKPTLPASDVFKTDKYNGLIAEIDRDLSRSDNSEKAKEALKLKKKDLSFTLSRANKANEKIKEQGGLTDDDLLELSPSQIKDYLSENIEYSPQLENGELTPIVNSMESMERAIRLSGNYAGTKISNNESRKKYSEILHNDKKLLIEKIRENGGKPEFKTQTESSLSGLKKLADEYGEKQNPADDAVAFKNIPVKRRDNQSGFHVGKTLINYADLEKLDNDKLSKIDSLIGEYNKIPYYSKDVLSFIGGNQAARTSERQKQKIMDDSLKANRIEDSIKELLKTDEQKSKEKDLQNKQDKQKELQKLLNRKEQIESFLSHKLNSPRDNGTKQEYRQLLQEIEKFNSPQKPANDEPI